MPSANTGKTITRLKINKKNVALYFNKKRLSISYDAYAISYLYVGKTLTDSEIKKIQNYSQITTLLNYALSLLKKGHYSEWKMREKLYKKEAKKKDVDLIIKRLKDIDLINDQMLIEDYLSYAEEKNISYRKILQDLQDKGIFSKDLQKIKFSESKEKKKALAQLKKIDGQSLRLSYEKRKQRVYQHLLGQGFNQEIVGAIINQIAPKKEEDEYQKLAKDYQRVSTSLGHRYEGEKLREKIYLSLKNKGYRYRDIVKIMEENNDGND